MDQPPLEESTTGISDTQEIPVIKADEPAIGEVGAATDPEQHADVFPADQPQQQQILPRQHVPLSYYSQPWQAQQLWHSQQSWPGRLQDKPRPLSVWVVTAACLVALFAAASLMWQSVGSEADELGRSYAADAAGLPGVLGQQQKAADVAGQMQGPQLMPQEIRRLQTQPRQFVDQSITIRGHVERVDEQAFALSPPGSQPLIVLAAPDDLQALSPGGSIEVTGIVEQLDTSLYEQLGGEEFFAGRSYEQVAGAPVIRAHTLWGADELTP